MYKTEKKKLKKQKKYYQMKQKQHAYSDYRIIDTNSIIKQKQYLNNKILLKMNYINKIKA
ncbi:hypothetical protein [Brachyspira murdochii]|uniref:Uncharacterized protein n=1 Tax=Brachyspira murdochii (strain ATCC 51284 / DSM 12563 / 56-150) TaxID=526224 RepID=D5UAZ3_BRAM5|nr:hypothetical protein [Brachyspira murdochii]ADG71866.1 conserved hypothetical protein [Brachyspira murdochii DSM 12563]